MSPFIRKDHPEIPIDMTADAHGQDSGNMRGGEYLSDPGFRTKLDNMGHQGAWTDEDAIYAKTHSGKAGRSLMAIISKYITDNGLRQAGQTPPATGEPAPAPSPAPAPVGRSGEFDDLELAIGHAGLGDGTIANALGALDALEAAFNAAAKKIRKKLEAGSVWEAAVNCPRLGRIFGNQGRFVGDELSTQPLQKRAYEVALGLTPSEDSGAGFSITGQPSG